MKKNFFILLSVLLSACVATQQEISTEIEKDDSLLTSVNEYQNKDEYKDIVKSSDFVLSLGLKNNLSRKLKKSEYEKLKQLNIQNVLGDICNECYKEMCIKCYKEKEECLFSENNDMDIIKKIHSLTTSFKQQYETYCERYDNKWAKNDERKAAKENCETTLREYFCDKVFNSSDINIPLNYVKSHMEDYEDKLWEKQTGCDILKYTDTPVFYRVLQQTNTGTIITIAPQFKELAYYGALPAVAFITKNKKDSKLTDDEMIGAGSFNEVGTYKYTNTRGGTSTVKKYKRCE